MFVGGDSFLKKLPVKSSNNVYVHFVRYESALERKTKILEIIRSLDLPNNPLDDIIDQVNCLYILSDLYLLLN